MGRYEELVRQITAKDAEIKGIWDAAGDEDLDRDTYKKVVDGQKQLAEWEAERKEIAEQRAARAESQERSAREEQEVKRNRLGHGAVAAEAKGQRQPQSVGEQVLGDEEFNAWRDRLTAGGKGVSRAQFGNSPAVSLKTLITGASSTSAGAFVTNDRLQIVDAGTFGRPLTIVDLITTGTTDSDTVEYVRQGTHTNNAAMVAEATATGNGSGAKPESAMAFSVVTESVKTVAHWLAATRRSLQDAGQLRTMIDSFLRYGLAEELEDQILNGDGSGENFTGIFNTSGTQSQAYDTSLLKTTRKARTKVRIGGRATPTAFLMHPNDWEAMDLLQDAENRYYFGGPMVLGTPRLWGLPVVESEAVTEGTALVGDFRMAALWRRMAAQILVSDSHSDFFVRNLIAILAEERAAFGVIRPSAFVEIDLTA
jgi:HK97 family phage major capsid protein